MNDNAMKIKGVIVRKHGSSMVLKLPPAISKKYDGIEKLPVYFSDYDDRLELYLPEIDNGVVKVKLGKRLTSMWTITGKVITLPRGILSEGEKPMFYDPDKNLIVIPKVTF